ncbi:MAG: Gfo/Idh/MocA family protein [Microcystaceae cyanobacterium]
MFSYPAINYGIVPHPLKVAMVGTGFASQRRAEALQTDVRAQLVGVAGHSPEKTADFCKTFGVPSVESWQALVNRSDVDLVMIGTINSDHAAIARTALEAGKHVVVEYPLALTVAEGEELIALARKNEKLLHIEHIELLGGVHQAIRQYLPEIGEVFYARYATIQIQNPAPRRWTYHYDQFGFPLTAALSRLHRFSDLFGAVVSVSCQARFWEATEAGYFRACLAKAQLGFANGLMADVIYGKGEVFYQDDRTFVLHGDRGTLFFDGEKGELVRGKDRMLLEVGNRRGLFAQDTQAVLDHLFEGLPLYVQPMASLYALKIAEAARRSHLENKTIFLN